MTSLKDIKRVIRSFKYAFDGISYVFTTQRNMQIHLLVALGTLLLAIFLRVPKEQLLLVFFSIVFVMCMELVNTALERVVDLVTEGYHPLAKIAKDVAAGAVLFAATFAFVIGVYVFLDPLLSFFSIPTFLQLDIIVILSVIGLLLFFILRQYKFNEERGSKIMSKEQLIEQAKEARKNAYVPYSNFPVGAALLRESGEVIIGSNIENASYGLTNCAERTAIFTAIANASTKNEKTFKALAIVADLDRPVPPCGACRQVLSEFCDEGMPVYLANLQGEIMKTTVGTLLPGAFEPKDLLEKGGNR